MARTPKIINWLEIKLRLQARNTVECICDEMDISRDTFYRRFEEEFGCSVTDYRTQARETGVANILYVQYINALKGNARMLELLGREWCGQGKEENANKSKEDNFDKKMSHIIELLSASDLKMDESNINKETKS